MTSHGSEQGGNEGHGNEGNSQGNVSLGGNGHGLTDKDHRVESHGNKDQLDAQDGVQGLYGQIHQDTTGQTHRGHVLSQGQTSQGHAPMTNSTEISRQGFQGHIGLGNSFNDRDRGTVAGTVCETSNSTRHNQATGQGRIGEGLGQNIG